MQTTVLRIGTRGSPLALAQAHETRARLMAAHGLPEDAFAIEVDLDQRRPHPGPAAVGSRRQGAVHQGNRGGAACRPHRHRRAFVEGHADACCPKGWCCRPSCRARIRATPSSARRRSRSSELPQGATVGSSSLRRQALILRMRPDLKVVMFRGNVQTRLRKLRRGRRRRHDPGLCRPEAARAASMSSPT